jgi:hypothetical protein
MWRSRGIDMEVVAVGIENKYVAVAEELQRRGVRVFIVPGNELVVYTYFSGFQELTGEDAERYISSLLEAYYIEYY